MRRLRAFAPGLAAIAALLAAVGAAAEPPEAGRSRLARLEAELSVALVSGEDPSAVGAAAEVLRSIRSAGAFSRAARLLLLGGRTPARVLSVGGGAHLGPLAVCEELPKGEACELEITDVDPSVQLGLEGALRRLAERGLLAPLGSTAEIPRSGGRREWFLSLSGRMVHLVLAVPPPGGSRAPRLFDPSRLSESDLLVAHDLASDPLAVVAIVLELLRAARQRPLPCLPPPLLVEDAGAHPYPVDMELLAPIGRLPGPYGHRAGRPLPGGGRAEESGAPLFGGAVLLGFGTSWWMDVAEPDLVSLLDFLLLSGFDGARRNVLEGGETPLLVPEPVDRWAGYGSRLLDGRRLDDGTSERRRVLEGAARARGLLPAALRDRLACHGALYRAVLEIAAGGGAPPQPPSLSAARELRAGMGAPPALEELLVRAAAGGLADPGPGRRRAGRARELLESGAVDAAGGPCRLVAGSGGDPPVDRWQRLLSALSSRS